RRPRARGGPGAWHAAGDRLTAPGMVTPPGRQGPGPMPAAAVAALDLRLVRRAESALPGEHLGSGVGEGTELAQIRPDLFGDDVRRLDAAASARTGEPQVCELWPDRALQTCLVLDTYH